MTPREFYDRCEKFDWFYAMSDDGRVYNAGKREHQELLALTETDPALAAIYGFWYAYMFSGPAFETERGPRPERP